MRAKLNVSLHFEFQIVYRVKNRIVIIVGLAFVGIFLLFLSADNAEQSAKKEVGQSSIKDINTQIPQKLTFAGERVPLENFDVRESLERELISNSYFHSQTIYLIKRAGRYLPFIEKILKQYGLPDDFKYLAVAESILFDKAHSPAGAAGIWQLMKTTAQGYGIEVNANVDERYNLDLASHAACKYLLESYEKYENWTLTAASYNMGRRGLDRSMEYQKVSDSYYNMYLNPETARYVYRILALKLILETPERYGFSIPEKEKYPVLEVDTVVVNYPIEHLTDFAKKHNMDYKTLKLLNPWLLENKLNNASKKTYKIVVGKKGFRKVY